MTAWAAGWAGPPRGLSQVWAATVDLVLPLTCAACGTPGSACCRTCRAALGAPRPRRVPTPPKALEPLPTTWAAADYTGAVRRLLVAYKDGDRRDLRPVLARALAPVLLAAAGPAARPGEVVAVPMPTSAGARRRRGDAPLEDLLTAAADLVRGVDGGPGMPVVQGLRITRRVRDQVRLDAGARAANLHGAFEAAEGALAGRRVVLVDDVATSGATLAEAVRALREVGAQPHACAVLAVTPRTGGTSGTGVVGRCVTRD